MRIALIALLILLGVGDTAAQKRGTLGVGFSMSLPYRGSVSIQYFFVDRIALDLSVGAIPHLFGFGGGINVHPFRGTTRPYFTLGGAHMRAPGSFPTHEEPTRPEAASLLVSQRTTFAYGGAGYNVTTRRGLQHPNFFSVVGASLVLAQTNRYQTGEVPAQTQQEAPPLFLPYFEVGARYFAENSSP